MSVGDLSHTLQHNPTVRQCLFRLFLEVLLIVPYVFLSIYHYTNAGDLYDLIVMPTAEAIRDLIILHIHKWSPKIKMYFDPDNLFLIKDKER